MKKFLLETKVSMGLASKTVDPEYDEKAAAFKTVEQSVREYSSAIDQMKRSVENVMLAMDKVSKAFNQFTSPQEIPEDMKAITTELQSNVTKLHEECAAEYSKALVNCAYMGGLKTMTEECRKLDNERSKTMGEYDAYRESVANKEAEYRKKGKDLSTSKHYSEEVATRDQKEKAFRAADESYKKKVDETLTKARQTVLAAMRDYTQSSATFMKELYNRMEVVNAKALKAKG